LVRCRFLLKHVDDGLRCDGIGIALSLPPNSGLPELGIVNCRSRIYPTSMGEGWGEGLRSLVGPAPPHPICCANRPLPAGERWSEIAARPIQARNFPQARPGMTPGFVSIAPRPDRPS